jgi:hypothetical protein
MQYRTWGLGRCISTCKRLERGHLNQTQIRMGRLLKCGKMTEDASFSHHNSEVKIRYDEAKGRKRTSPQVRVLIETIETTAKTRNRVVKCQSVLYIWTGRLELIKPSEYRSRIVKMHEHTGFVKRLWTPNILKLVVRAK